MGHFEPPGRSVAPSLALRDGMSRMWSWLRRDPFAPQRWRADRRVTTQERAILPELRALLDALPLGAVLLDVEDAIVVVNTAAMRLLGHPDGELRGTPVQEALPDYPRDGEQSLVRADGAHAPVSVEANAVQCAGQEFRLLLLKECVGWPHRKNEPARQRDEIAHLSRVAMLGELSGALAHELNQPLATILTNAQAAQRLLRLRGDTVPTHVLNDILADIVAEDRRAGDIIQRLRQWLRKEHPEPVALVVNDVILDALHLVRNDLLQRGVNVQLELAGNLPAIDGDRILMQQVLLNFVLNGCDAMDGLPLPHLLRVRSRALADGGVRVEVLDRGRGIAPEILPVMFDPFETTKPGGMGMGLAVCRNIVESHRGRVFAHPLAEGGACVGFEMPGGTP